ncbi:MAG: SBBP repeat-containing protein, partial [Methanobacterium sp.]|uniref:SBBP repeat-containing protein n=1 Tax=Methanobacterium sp. TaxID=2164 RepID=UPI003C71DDA0
MFRNKEKLLLLMFLTLFFCISGVGAASAAEVPVANFTSNVTNGAAPLSVQFNDTSTGNPTSWYWDFGDNQNSTVQNPTHTYTNAGTYNVSETVTTVEGSNTDTQNNYIAVIPTNYVTYLGGNQTDQGHSIAVDSKGNIYVTGSTISANFPTTSNAYQKTYSGGQDAFLSEFNSSGNLIYSTYLGGDNTDYGWNVVVGNNGIIYVAGWTNSTDFPTTNGAYQTSNNGLQNAFLSEFNST